MKAYKVEGTFWVKDRWQPFKKEVVGTTEDEALEAILSVMGSRHKVNRKQINIASITEVPLDDIEDAIVKYMVEKDHAE
jgi:ribosomal protein L20A (L18A)